MNTDTEDAMDSRHYVSRSVMEQWYRHGPRTLDLPIAFTIIRYYKGNTQPLYEAAFPIHRLVRTKQVAEQSPEQIAPLLDHLNAAIQPFLTLNWFAMIHPKDPWWAVIRPYYEFYTPVIPDPSNSIDLRAFAFDTQSVHRSSTQTAMETSLARVCAIPLPDDMEALGEFLSLEDTLIPDALLSDYATLTIPLKSQTICYATAFNHLWAYIRSHEHKEELVKRLSEEIRDGVGMCANGRLARLMNVVEGYMEGVSTASRKELFQNRMAVIAKMEKSAQQEAARKAFQEFEIPEGERGTWLEALE